MDSSQCMTAGDHALMHTAHLPLTVRRDHYMTEFPYCAVPQCEVNQSCYAYYVYTLYIGATKVLATYRNLS